MLSIITAAQAASLIRDADTLIVGGNGGTGAAEAILDALEQRFLGGHGPHGLTLINITGVGAVTEKGLCHLAHEGLVTRVIGGRLSTTFWVTRKVMSSAARPIATTTSSTLRSAATRSARRTSSLIDRRLCGERGDIIRADPHYWPET